MTIDVASLPLWVQQALRADPNARPRADYSMSAVFRSAEPPAPSLPNTPIGADFFALQIPGPWEVAGDADTPPEQLRELARQYPEAVLRNPALPLLALSQPDAWRVITYAARNTMAHVGIARLRNSLPAPSWLQLEQLALGRAEAELGARTHVPAEVARVLQLVRTGNADAIAGGLDRLYTFASQNGPEPFVRAGQLLIITVQRHLSGHASNVVAGVNAMLNSLVRFWVSTAGTDDVLAVERELLELEAQVEDARSVRGELAADWQPSP